jgi:uncharacterized small protein (TIGR04563 family)
MAAKKKLTLYFPEEMLKETKLEALRQDRSVSWIIQTAWRLARDEVKRYPGINELWGEEEELDSRQSA